MVKAYLRYDLANTFGVVASNSNVVYDHTGKLAITACLENICLWNVKQGTLVKTLVTPATSGKAPAEVTQIAVGRSDSHQIAVGHADGTVRLWNLQSGTCDVTLSGHKGAVTALKYNLQGGMLASGAQDTDIIVWDVAAEAGLYRLRGHQDQVTDLAFLQQGNKLISCSKDSHIRVWDLSTQHCSQTLVGYRGEVWALALDPSQRRLVTGSADVDLQVYEVVSHEAAEQEAGAAVQYDTLRSSGSIRRQSTDRVSRLCYDQAGEVLACQTTGKLLDFFKVRSGSEAQKHMRRRKKRKREKISKSQPGDVIESEAQAGSEEAAAQDQADDTLTAADELAPLQTIRCKHKIRSFALAPTPTAKNGIHATIALVNNSLEVWNLNDADVSILHALEAPGHRSDIRTVALSSDDSLLLSGSNNEVKIWNPRSGACLRTIEAGYGLCAIFAPGNRHAVVGTKEGTLDVIDVGASSRLDSLQAHSGAVWSLAALPDNSGFVSGSAAKEVKFWEWAIVEQQDSQARQLTVNNTRTLEMTDDVLCVRISPNGKLIAVALLDSTIKLFFTDTLKFFLSLYGHKLPVLSMDISSDSTLLVSGAADKNIKIWGLDFGDCHRSLFAHADSVMQVAFVHNTHYVFTAGKDKVIKYWDADKFEHLLTLEGHHSEVWCMALSAHGDFLVTGSHDRSLRRWERTDEPFFVEEEREKRLESMFEADVEGPSGRPKDGEGGIEGSVAPAGKKTLETLGAADSIAEALEMAANERKRHEEYVRDREGDPSTSAPPPNPLMMGMDAGGYVLKAVGSVKAADLEQALLVLPFTEALRLLSYLCQWLRKGLQTELCCRVSTLLVRLHHPQLVATPSARPTLIQLQTLLRQRVQGLKDTMGFNVAALQHLKRSVKERQAGMLLGQDEDGLASRPVKRRIEASA
ncbi:hypothetical protein ABBQ38_009019 [Trebouxia sp. C0009 RCD-2024]